MKSDPQDTSGPLKSSRPLPRSASTSGRESLLTHVSHRAMATDFVVMLPEHAADGVEVVLEALEMLDSIEASLTIYKANGEVSRLNRDGAFKPVKMSGATFRLLEKSILWSQRTSGAFDITAGPLVEAWGFTRRNGSKPTAEEIQTARDLVGFNKILLDPHNQTAQLATAGMTINLGAIGKGDALDRLAAHLKKSGVADFLIHGGNSSLIAAGDQDHDSGRGWAVGIAHPTKPKRRLCGLYLKDRALATSGSGKQFFHHQGRRFGHVIDPRTGYPAGDLASLTILMESAADADAAATGLFVMGSHAIGEITEPWIQCPMILAATGRRQDEVDVSTVGQIDWIDPPAESESDG
ncbi:FAD:protein FMN transferase [Rubripirellula reticaptiva]|uniref:FAD:protein FMN transferase n=1 Tax=Rubripirellula reticaptiva TaxID=2528013 RepID=A0A5C6F3R0_9BACT|nr:FAD:protein FMN transferase [Rubripirellula reticaptiva]TWU55077.1 Thiamine biosynthesis lipoprotein ApbE precursor [Rubripirellula reticaptiva]